MKVRKKPCRLLLGLSMALLLPACPAGAVDPGPQTGGSPGKNVPGARQVKPTSGTSQASESGPGQPAKEGESAPSLKVTQVLGVRHKDNKASLYNSEPVRLTVEGLPDWVKTHGKVSEIVLYLDGRAVPGLPVRLVSLGEAADTAATKPATKETPKGILEFDLQRNKDSNAAWKILLARPDDWRRTFQATVGVGDRPRTDFEGSPLVLEVFSERWLWIFVAILGAGLLVFWAAAIYTNMLRDTTRPAAAGERRPYSLGRCQMAFWFFLVVATYVLIYLITGDYGALTASALGLIGISSVTALGSIAVDVVNTVKPVAPAPAAAPAAAVAAAPANAATAIVKALPFFQDLLGTDDGNSLHRLQMMIWTVVLGVIFVTSVWSEFAMPAFSTEVLALMGISGGTYIGFKLPEKPK
jgi:hypothetical protein